MKANEAPEKIYLQENTTTDCYDKWWPEWFEARAKDDDIEYIRTDAFIEKACEWLEKNIFYDLNLDFGYSLQIKEFVDRFKECMKGE